MNVTKENNKLNVVLKNKEKVSISSEDGHIVITIKCLGKSLHIEERTKDGLLIEDEEEKAIKAMKKYLKNNKQ